MPRARTATTPPSPASPQAPRHTRIPALSPARPIPIKQENRKLFGYGGLKVEVRHEKLKIHNRTTKRKAYTEIVQFKLLSADDTLPLFEDFITRIEKHCKEIFYTKDSKHEIAYKCTKPLPSKEELKKIKEEVLKRKALEDAGELTPEQRK